MPITESRKARHLVAGVTALALASAVAVATVAPAAAAPVTHGQDDFEPFVLADGQACAGFDLSLGGTGDKRAIKEFDNGVVLSAGNGFDLTFTNLSNGESITLLSPGSVERVTPNADGSSTVQNTGHNVVILFPTDTPAGPSTTLYTGRIVYNANPYPNGVFTVLSTSGRTTDICALLA